MHKPRIKPKTFQVSIRIAETEAHRADRIAQLLATARPDTRAFLVSRSGTLRLAMLRGLDALEAEAGMATTAPRRRRSKSWRIKASSATTPEVE